MNNYPNRQMASTRYHECPVNRCDKQINYYLAMCRVHWGLVPTNVQRDLYTAWNGGSPREGHFEVLQLAIDLANESLWPGW